MRSLVVGLSVVLAVCLAGCDWIQWGMPCTALYAYGVSATVTDSVTGDPIANAVLTLADGGSYTEQMQLVPTNDYVGAGERPGTYTLTATAPGYQQQVIQNIVVGSDECHVIGVHLDVKLVPNS